jgi:hypothetical protein
LLHFKVVNNQNVAVLVCAVFVLGVLVTKGAFEADRIGYDPLRTRATFAYDKMTVSKDAAWTQSMVLS